MRSKTSGFWGCLGPRGVRKTVAMAHATSRQADLIAAPCWATRGRSALRPGSASRREDQERAGRPRLRCGHPRKRALRTWSWSSSTAVTSRRGFGSAGRCPSSRPLTFSFRRACTPGGTARDRSNLITASVEPAIERPHGLLVHKHAARLRPQSCLFPRLFLRYSCKEMTIG